jgi:hypothetical protein
MKADDLRLSRFFAPDSQNVDLQHLPTDASGRLHQLTAANTIRFPLGERLLCKNGKPVGDLLARLDGGADATKQSEQRGRVQEAPGLTQRGSCSSAGGRVSGVVVKHPREDAAKRRCSQTRIT